MELLLTDVFFACGNLSDPIDETEPLVNNEIVRELPVTFVHARYLVAIFNYPLFFETCHDIGIISLSIIAHMKTR